MNSTTFQHKIVIMISVRRNLVKNISLLKQNNDKTLVEQCVVNSYSMCAYISPRGIHTRKVCYSINSGNSRALIHGDFTSRIHSNT